MTTATVVDVLNDVLATSGYQPTHLELRQVPPAPNLQQRVGEDVAAGILASARELSHDEGIPFWHSVFRIGAQSATGVPAPIVEAALYSQGTTSYGTVAVAEDFTAAAQRLVESAPTQTYIVASSGVPTDRGTLHVPFLDFSVKERWAGAERTAVAAAEALGIAGTVLASGRSFHFIGKELLSWERYAAFLYRALLLAPLVDERWIAHQLLAGEATLRVSPNSAGHVPTAVAYVRGHSS